QGFGDAIQFIRYARRLKDLGARVIFDTFQGFDEISRDFEGVDQVLVEGTLPRFDYRIPLLSLPRVFGTDLASIPATVPYVNVRPSYLDRWTHRIPAVREIKVGLVWAGNPKHQRDRQRSIPLATLAPLFGVEGVRFHSLQKSPTAAAEIAASGFDLVDLGPDLDDFSDTAAAISRLDLVISVDTSVAHLAGALAKPVWLMLPRPPDWRWMLEGSRSAWYPTMRLFRQREVNRWEPVAEEVGQALRERVRMAGGEASGSAPMTPVTIAQRSGAQPGAAEPQADAQPPKLCRVTEARYGIVQYVPDAGEAAEGLRHYGEHRHAELALMARFIRPGGWVLQVGAGIGVDSLFLSQAVGDAGHLLAYESDPLLHQLAYQNLAANRVRNATLLRRYLGRGPAQDPAGGRAGALAASLPDWIDGLRLERLDWIRINDGRSAPTVLAGAVDTLWRLRPWIFVSAHSDAESNAVAATARDHGYQSWRFDVPLFNPDNYNRRSDDIFSGRHAQGALCIPEEIEMDIDLEGCAAMAPPTG
ncbi:MAG: glycosyltransferase family 9 protein, partial [Casimicrobiaceae bacterium]